MYELRYTREAARAMARLPRTLRGRIERRLVKVAEAPERARGVVRLEARPGYRLRVGEWRVIFEVDRGALIVLVLRVAPRGEVYKR